MLSLKASMCNPSLFRSIIENDLELFCGFLTVIYAIIAINDYKQDTQKRNGSFFSTHVHEIPYSLYIELKTTYSCNMEFVLVCVRNPFKTTFDKKNKTGFNYLVSLNAGISNPSLFKKRKPNFSNILCVSLNHK